MRFLIILLVASQLLACSDVSKNVCLGVGIPPTTFLVASAYLESHHETNHGSAFWINALYPSGFPAKSSDGTRAISILVRGLRADQAAYAEYSYRQRFASRPSPGTAYEMADDGNVVLYQAPLSTAKLRSVRRRLSETVELTYIFPDELYGERRQVDAAVVKLVNSMRAECKAR